MAWPVIADLEAHLGKNQDALMVSDLAAANAWVQSRRRDIATNGTPPANVAKAVLIYAGLLYRERSNPSGFSTYQDIDDGSADTGDALANVYRLLGGRKPVAR